MSNENRPKASIGVNFNNCTIGRVQNFESSQNITIHSGPQYVLHGSQQNRETLPVHHPQFHYSQHQQPFQRHDLRPSRTAEYITHNQPSSSTGTSRDIDLPAGEYNSVLGLEREDPGSSRGMISPNRWDHLPPRLNMPHSSRMGRPYTEVQENVLSEIPIDQQSMASCLQESSWANPSINTHVNPDQYAINPRYVKQPSQNYHSFADEHDSTILSNIPQSRKAPIEIDETEENY